MPDTDLQPKKPGWIWRHGPEEIPDLIKKMIWGAETFEEFKAKCNYAFNDAEILVTEVTWTSQEREIFISLGDGSSYNVAC